MQFKRIYVEITNTCNLSCSFCIQNQRKPRRMSVAQFSHVIREIKPYTGHVYLHVLGEPLSHPDLKTFLQICDEQGMQVNLTTNGTLLKACRDVLINSRLRQVNVSLHSFPSMSSHSIWSMSSPCVRSLPSVVYISAIACGVYKTECYPVKAQGCCSDLPGIITYRIRRNLKSVCGWMWEIICI